MQPLDMKYFMLVLFILVGAVTGVLAGLLGIGGGVITVPALYYILYFYDFPREYIMHTSIATALAATFLTSIGSTWAHYQKKAILKTPLMIIVPGLLLGTIFGAPLTEALSSNLLREIFGAMAIVFSFYFMFPRLPNLYIAAKPNFSLALLGIIFGILSTLLGIGGGIFMVPALLGYQIPLRNVVATSSAGTLATALAGSIAYLVVAWDLPHLPETIGFIQIPAFLLIGICSLFTTSLGVRLAHALPALLIKKIFAIALGATGIAMTLGR